MRRTNHRGNGMPVAHVVAGTLYGLSIVLAALAIILVAGGIL